MTDSQSEKRAGPNDQKTNGERPWRKKAEKAEKAEAAAAADFETPESRKLCEAIADASSGICFLGFSRGKDSICSWLYLRRFFKRIIPFHCASVPHLAFVDQSLNYYERFFQVPILRLMDGDCLKALNNLIWQPHEAESEIDAMELWEYDKHEIIELLRQDLHLPAAWCAFGINASDSIDRRIYVGKNHGRNPRWMTFYPTYDWKKAQVMAYVQAHDVKLPADYTLATRSMAAVPTYRHLLRMEAMFPDDYRRVELMYPMIRAELARQCFREKKWTGIPKAKAAPCMGPARMGETNQSPSTGGR